MKPRMLQVMVSVDADAVIHLIEDDIEEMVRLYTDAEITHQFESIQNELEGILKQYLKEYIDSKNKLNYSMESLETALKETENE